MVLRLVHISHNSRLRIVYFNLLNLLLLLCLQHVFKYFTERTPGSYLETSEASLVWNYENAGDHMD